MTFDNVKINFIKDCSNKDDINSESSIDEYYINSNGEKKTFQHFLIDYKVIQEDPTCFTNKKNEDFLKITFLDIKEYCEKKEHLFFTPSNIKDVINFKIDTLYFSNEGCPNLTNIEITKLFPNVFRSVDTFNKYNKTKKISYGCIDKKSYFIREKRVFWIRITEDSDIEQYYQINKCLETRFDFRFLVQGLFNGNYINNTFSFRSTHGNENIKINLLNRTFEFSLLDFGFNQQLLKDKYLIESIKDEVSNGFIVLNNIDEYDMNLSLNNNGHLNVFGHIKCKTFKNLITMTCETEDYFEHLKKINKETINNCLINNSDSDLETDLEKCFNSYYLFDNEKFEQNKIGGMNKNKVINDIEYYFDDVEKTIYTKPKKQALLTIKLKSSFKLHKVTPEFGICDLSKVNNITIQKVILDSIQEIDIDIDNSNRFEINIRCESNNIDIIKSHIDGKYYFQIQEYQFNYNCFVKCDTIIKKFNIIGSVDYNSDNIVKQDSYESFVDFENDNIVKTDINIKEHEEAIKNIFREMENYISDDIDFVENNLKTVWKETTSMFSNVKFWVITSICIFLFIALGILSYKLYSICITKSKPKNDDNNFEMRRLQNNTSIV